MYAYSQKLFCCRLLVEHYFLKFLMFFMVVLLKIYNHISIVNIIWTHYETLGKYTSGGKNPYSYHSKTDTLQYIVYSCFCAQVYDYNCVKLCIQNSYLHYLCGIIKYFHFNVFRCSYNSVLIVYYVCFYYNHNTYPEEKLENTVNLKRENITHISSTQQNIC